MTTLMKTPNTDKPTPLENLNNLIALSSHQKEDMVFKLHELRSKNNSAYSITEAEDDVVHAMTMDAVMDDAHRSLKSARYSPFVSRETQIAVLKGMILDYENGRNRKGLSALTVLKAVELLNKMTGYEAPIKQEVKTSHTVHVLPMVGESFKGEMPPLKIIDIDSTVVMNDDDFIRKDETMESLTEKEVEEQAEKDDEYLASLSPEDLFP